jgi:hypothetical protein
MSEADTYVTPGEPAAKPRAGRVQAMFRSLLVSVAQVAAAAVVAYGCITASTIAPRNSSPDIADGVPFILAAIVLVPLGAMIVGSLVAKRLRLAEPGAYSLSVIVVIVVLSINPANAGAANLPIAILVPTAVNLLIAFSAGLRRVRLRARAHSKAPSEGRSKIHRSDRPF